MQAPRQQQQACGQRPPHRANGMLLRLPARPFARLAGGSKLIPFGPYLLLGALLSLFFGDAVITWYLGLFTV